MIKPLASLLALTASLLLIAACGGDDNGDGSGGETDASAGGDPTRLAFYDWEPNVIPNPNAPDAERATETPFARRSDAKRVAAGAGCGNEGCVLLAEEVQPGGVPQGYFVLRDRPALTGAEIVEPEIVDGPPPLEGALLQFDFTAAGAQRFQAMTRAVAERGRESAPAGIGPPDAPIYSDHFAVVFDDQIMSRPIVDFVENPEGIDGRHGAGIEGGLSEEQMEELVALLGSDDGG